MFINVLLTYFGKFFYIALVLLAPATLLFNLIIISILLTELKKNAITTYSSSHYFHIYFKLIFMADKVPTRLKNWKVLSYITIIFYSYSIDDVRYSIIFLPFTNTDFVPNKVSQFSNYFFSIYVLSFAIMVLNIQ